jgi:hypothetical protein
LGLGKKTFNESNIFNVRETRENETDAKNEMGSGVVMAGVEQTDSSAQPLKTNVTAAVAESQTVSSSLRKRRLSTAMRQETQASPLPLAAALTMSESLYNHFHPLDEEVPEDHRLPFLNFGKKLVPVNAKTTSSVASLSSASSTDSFEAVSTPPVGQYNLLSTTPQRVLSANAPSAHIPREEEIHEDMDVSVMKSVVEKNKATRSRGNSPQSLRKLGGLYRKQETSTPDIAENASSVRTAHAVSTEKSAPRTEQRASNNSESDKNIRKKLGSLHNASTASSTEILPISKDTQRKSGSGNHSTTDRPNNSEVTSYSSSHNKYRSESTQNAEIPKPKPASPTSRSAIPTQLSASSLRIEATVSTPFARGRPLLPTRNVASYALLNRRPPQSYQHSYRQSSALSKSSKLPESISKPSNISVYSESETSPEKEISVTNTSVTTNSNEKSTARTSSIPVQIKPAFPNSHTGRKGFVDGAASGDESDGYITELMKSEEKLIADTNGRNTKREPLTKSNASLFEDTVNNFGRNITSELPIESVTTKLITSTSPQSGDSNVTIPTEVSSITTSIQSPTTKILSTAVVTSVSIEGAWPVMVTDTPALEQTLVPPQIFASQKTKNERLERVLEQPERYGTNRTQSYVNESIMSERHHVSISTDRSLLREFAGNTSSGGNSTSADTSSSGDNSTSANTSSSGGNSTSADTSSSGGNSASTDTNSSGGNSTVTNGNKEGNGISRTQKFATAIKNITSNFTEIPHVDTEKGQSNSTTISINKINSDQASESSEPLVGRGTVGIMKEAKTSSAGTTGNPDATLKNSRRGGVAYPVTSPAGTSKPSNPKPAARNSRNRNGTPTARTGPEDSAKSDKVTSHGTPSAQSPVTIVPPATDAEFDFPLLKLYNASTASSVPARGVTKSPGEASEYPSTGNGSTTHNSEPDLNITEATTRKGGVVDELTEAKESVNTTGDISEGESGKVAAGKDGQEGIRPITEADLTNSSTFVSNGGVNTLLDIGNGLSGNNRTTGSPRPGESVATTQGVSIAIYVLSALGVVPLTIGIALTARYCVRRRRKVSFT